MDYSNEREIIFKKYGIKPAVDMSKETYICDCGLKVKTKLMGKHEKTIKHNKRIETLCRKVEKDYKEYIGVLKGYF